MPRISAKIERCTFFLYGPHPKTGKIEIGGTGCIVYPSIGAKIPSYYAVTNFHVVSGGASWIRLNLYPDGSETIQIDPSEWTLVKELDLAVIDITEILAEKKHLVSAIGTHQFCDQFAVERDELYLGDDVFMVGLFSNYYNDDKNTPVARFGNICRPAESKYPVRLGDITEMPCHLIDMRSRPGFSGSPVWIYRTPATDLSEFHAGGQVDSYMEEPDPRWEGQRDRVTDKWALRVTTNNLFLRFLGIHSSQFNEFISVEVVKETERRGDPVKEGDRLKIQSSVTMVIPAHNIISILNDNDLVEKRLQREEEFKRSKEYEQTGQPESLNESTKDESEQEGDVLLKKMLDTPPSPKSG